MLMAAPTGNRAVKECTAANDVRSLSPPLTRPTALDKRFSLA